MDPSIKRLSILTEDHPLDYLLFEGVIPEGNYGAGTVIVWDTGTYTTKSDLSEQFNKGKIGFILNGQKLRGRFYLVRTSTENQWLLFKKSDQFDSKEDLTISKPESVLTGRGNDQLATTKRKRNSSEFNTLYEAKNPKKTTSTIHNVSLPQDFPTNIKPMLATLVDKPFNNKDWVFEIKWDGIRSIFYFRKPKDILKLQSRNGIDITHRYPEIIESLRQVIKYSESVIVDGEIVVLNKEGYPEFGSHKERMSINSDREISRLSKTIPATYYLFDILYCDGQDLRNRDYIDRREILNEVISQSNNKKRVRVSDYIEQQGIAVFENIKKMNLEGIIAKRKNSKYIQGTRSKDWLKIKNSKTQDCVVTGYTSGEGSREKYFGSLILAVYEQGRLRFAGHTGSGFNTNQLVRVYTTIKDMRTDKPPIDHIPYLNGKPTWIKPQLVAEIKFDNWTNEKILRAPIFQRFREDKSPEDCTVQGERHLEEVVAQRGKEEVGVTATTLTINQKPNPLLNSFSNLDKVFWDKTSEHPQLTKRDLIEYYDKVGKHILPHLKDRPLSLSRYPDGIKGKSFYHKNWNQAHPDYVKTVKVYSETRGDVINYILGNNKETLLWIANLGCIEMHPWYSRVIDSDSCKNFDELDENKCGLSFPDFVIFDLDPYIYSGNENKGKEPEYNVKGFKSAVEVAFSLKELFDELKIISYVKTSGKTGLHIFVPVVRAYAYDQTRAFAEIVGTILTKRIPQKITTIWDTTQRRGKVFFDFNQNAKGKTIASVFSARPSASATVSMPVKWEDLDEILPSDFAMLNVPEILKRHADPWRDILVKGQDLAKILDNLSSK